MTEKMTVIHITRTIRILSVSTLLYNVRDRNAAANQDYACFLV